MDIDNLVRMANRIGQFFEAMPHAQEAQQGIAQHLHKFWEPRMRKALLDHLDHHDGEGLRPAVKAAIQSHRDELAVSPQHPVT